ncbi:hypothetical protein JCM8208_006058 [Rhodotorula glutinis]
MSSSSRPSIPPLDPPEPAAGRRDDEARSRTAGPQRPELRQRRTDAQAIEAALLDALKLSDDGEAQEPLAAAQVDRRSAVASPPPPPSNAPVRHVRPPLQSVQSSFLTNYSSTRSPASRTTSQTSIISTHESVPSTSSSMPTKSAPQSPYSAPHVLNYGPTSPTMRRMSRNPSWAPPSRSPSVSSESAYQHLLPYQAGPPFPGFYPGQYPVAGAAPYGPPRPPSSNAQYPHALALPPPQVAFAHPFSPHEPVVPPRVSPPYVAHSPGWQQQHPGVPHVQPVPYTFAPSPQGSVVYDESGSPVWAYPQAFSAPPMSYYPSPPSVAGPPFAAYPHPPAYPPATVGPSSGPTYPSTSTGPAHVGYPRHFSPVPASPSEFAGVRSGPYSPHPDQASDRGSSFQYPISSNRSSMSSHPSSRASWSTASGPPGGAPFTHPHPHPHLGGPPPIPPRPVLHGSHASSSLQPHSGFSPMPTLGERDSSGGGNTSIGSPAANPTVSVSGASPSTMSGNEAGMTSAPFGPVLPESAPGPYVKRRDLPRPPTHSPHALWVGNVPSDASHAELWQFFKTRPTPQQCGVVVSPGASPFLDLETNGVESIHLIARSNCAFVNYLTPLHLRHAIAVSNGVALRPDDLRAKKLVCRVRHQGDDARTGVGAQRQGGMHKAFVREQQARMVEAQKALARLELSQAQAQAQKKGENEAADEKREGEESVGPLSPLSAGRSEREMSLASIRSGSTTSSFLAKHFERRYFILKSHNEQDLLRAVETGSWATQAHNEPVLHQAFRTARSVYLIFGVNGSGCWFGYARMVGPISGQAISTSSSRQSRSSHADKSSASTDMRMSSTSQTIPEEEEQQLVSGATSRASSGPTLFSPSEHRLCAQSPQAWTPSPSASYAGRLASGLSAATPSANRTPTYTTGGGGSSNGGGSAPATLSARNATRDVPLSVQLAMSREQDLIARETADNLHLPPAAAEAARRAASLDSSMPPPSGSSPKGSQPVSSTGATRCENEREPSLSPGELGSASASLSVSNGPDSPRKELIANAAQARNARLDAMAGSKQSLEVPSPSGTMTESRPGVTRNGSWGTPFAVEWIKVAPLPFARTRHIRNSFNGNREIKISRDGTEVEPTAGEHLLSEWWRERNSPSSSSSPSADDAPQRPPSPQPVLGASAGAKGQEPDEVLKQSVKLEEVEDDDVLRLGFGAGQPLEASGLAAMGDASPTSPDGRANTA